MSQETPIESDNVDQTQNIKAGGAEQPLIEQVPPKSSDDVNTHRFECFSCGFIYDPLEGVKKFGIPSGTSFLELDPETFRCPVCRARINSFRDIGPRTKPSGFEENINYGFGVNNLTPGQKNVLIFGGLAFILACFLSLYSLN